MSHHHRKTTSNHNSRQAGTEAGRQSVSGKYIDNFKLLALDFNSFKSDFSSLVMGFYKAIHFMDAKHVSDENTKIMCKWLEQAISHMDEPSKSTQHFQHLPHTMDLVARFFYNKSNDKDSKGTVSLKELHVLSHVYAEALDAYMVKNKVIRTLDTKGLATLIDGYSNLNLMPSSEFMAMHEARSIELLPTLPRYERAILIPAYSHLGIRPSDKFLQVLDTTLKQTMLDNTEGTYAGTLHSLAVMQAITPHKQIVSDVLIDTMFLYAEINCKDLNSRNQIYLASQVLKPNLSEGLYDPAIEKFTNNIVGGAENYFFRMLREQLTDSFGMEYGLSRGNWNKNISSHVDGEVNVTGNKGRFKLHIQFDGPYHFIRQIDSNEEPDLSGGTILQNHIFNTTRAQGEKLFRANYLKNPIPEIIETISQHIPFRDKSGNNIFINGKN